MKKGPYLETCCRSALHRLFLSGQDGRPSEAIKPGRFPDFKAVLKDRPCLERLLEMGLATKDAENRFFITEAGIEQHDHEMCPTKKAQKRFSLRYKK